MFTISTKFVFNPEQISPEYINLMPTTWEEMAYDRSNLNIIDFPWEYDIAWITIKVYASKADKLNFLVTEDNKTFAIIQSPEVLELDEIDWVDTRYFFDESISKKLDQLELEWDRVNLLQKDE